LLVILDECAGINCGCFAPRTKSYEPRTPSHYNGNAETYLDIGEAMGKAMVQLLENGK
jgi:hypothetical protein